MGYLNALREPAWEPCEPLWKRVPTRGDDGRPLSDFMMIIPALRDRPPHRFQSVVNEIEAVFAYYRHAVVFADLNVRLNLLWVSVKPIPGICLELATALKLRVPEARLVAPRMHRE
ncbi:MAG: hypothetical protein KGJ12_05690 [Gammaproteobacteria bacterium]|nr:hypothetical protein [Gammaproteobacteria bacterium]